MGISLQVVAPESVVLDTPRIKVASSERALVGEVHYAQRVGGVGWGPF